MHEPLIRAPAREDASHAPPQAARPLPLRAWPVQRGPVINDNVAPALPAFGVCEIDWQSFTSDTGTALVTELNPAREPRRRPRLPLRRAACAAAGIAGLLIAAVVLVVH